MPSKRDRELAEQVRLGLRKKHQREQFRKPIPMKDFFEVELTKGEVAKVCACHVDLIRGVNWHVRLSQNGIYYAGRDTNAGRIWMHHIVLPPSNGMVIDHINGDGLDNRCSNLRIVTYSQNAQNQHVTKAKSGYVGVGFRRDRAILKSNQQERKLWFARIRKNNKLLHLGNFYTAEEAARAYDRAARKLYGPLARVNFKP